MYKAANWLYVGETKGYQRTRNGYTAKAQSPKMFFVKPLQADAQMLMKRTNEIKIAAPLLDAIAIQGMEISADALLTQRDFAEYLVKERSAHYHFAVKGNQSGLYKDIELFFQDRQDPDYVEPRSLEHGRITTRRIWTTTELNEYLDFPYGQAGLCR